MLPGTHKCETKVENCQPKGGKKKRATRWTFNQKDHMRGVPVMAQQ